MVAAQRRGIPGATEGPANQPTNKEGPSEAQPTFQPGLLEGLTSAYATLVKRQRTASAAFVRWSSSHQRAHEFTWLEPGDEVLVSRGNEIRIPPSSPIHDSIQKMMATIELNPYERELLYGYPYIVGQAGDVPIRAPVLTVPITIRTEGGTLIISASDENVRFNSLPFRSELDSAAHELALARLIEATPEFPVENEALRSYCQSLAREMKVAVNGKLDSTIGPVPVQPRRATSLGIVDSAACFVAPKTSYFLVSDLENIGKNGVESARNTALGWLVGRRPQEPTSNIFNDSRRLCFPFSSNPSQRRVGLLAEDSKNRIIVVQGPPGTGKSLTIANVVCHLIAKGKHVLVTSQRDKALEVVDELLRTLNLDQLPMTLLRQDRESRRELRERLDHIEKKKSVEESRRQCERDELAQAQLVQETTLEEQRLAHSVEAEHPVAKAHCRYLGAKGLLSKLWAHLGFWHAQYKANKKAPRTSDLLADSAAQKRTQLLEAALRLLCSAAEHRTGDASKNERNQLREFSKLLGRNQANYKNFRIFDRLKAEPERCSMLLKVLPCWILSPDDVARLFPCEAGLFDTVIIDEASQCDLPSMAPVLYRAKQAIVVGDSKQMQAQRFAFTSTQVAVQAWCEQGLDRFDPDRWLDPSKIDLLQLASVRMDEEVLLDEHYRSLPPIIEFSNERWYGGRLRLMRDIEDRRFGDGQEPIIVLHPVTDGYVEPNTQQNQNEAMELVNTLRSHLEHPGYADASFGVLCLFEEQMRLVNDLIAENIAEDIRSAHDLVVVNPDGFQGDERDVIYYSLSYDAKGMQQSALSARQAEREHIQGMLNVAFTRPRDEMHIFHTAEIKQFGMASGAGAIRDWLEHCDRSGRSSRPSPAPVTQAQSEFEAQVIEQLSGCGVAVKPQYPCCGYFIDLVAEFGEKRIAVECDGEIWHLDEHGKLKLEDIQRQEILERAGWRVMRIPYRGWLADADAQVRRILDALTNDPPPALAVKPEPESTVQVKSFDVDTYQSAVIQAMKVGARDRDDILKKARELLGKSRLGPQIRLSLGDAISSLQTRNIIVCEDGEIFFPNEDLRNAVYVPKLLAPSMRSSRRGYRTRRSYYRPR
jgi:very-short-patch-repair endonuclease